jgi:hypothetical protein
MRRLYLVAYKDSMNGRVDQVEKFQLVTAQCGKDWDEQKCIKWAGIIFKEWFEKTHNYPCDGFYVQDTVSASSDTKYKYLGGVGRPGDAVTKKQIPIEDAQNLLYRFWQSSSDACPLEATLMEEQVVDFRKFVRKTYS